MAKKSELVKDLNAGQQLLRVDDLSQASGIKSLSETFRGLYPHGQKGARSWFTRLRIWGHTIRADIRRKQF